MYWSGSRRIFWRFAWDGQEFRFQNVDKHPILPASSLLLHFCLIRLFDHVSRLEMTVVL